MSSLLERLKKNSTIKEAAILNESMVFKKEELVTTDIPMLNVAQSGSLDGGFGPGLTLWCGNSKHFKTLFLLMNVKAYLDKYKDVICLFYDSEFGAPQSYFESVGIDPERVLHIPIVNIEELKFDVTKQLDEIRRGDRVFIAVDSVGNLASKKEAEDALEGKSVADMTRAKQLKSVFRIITPHLTLKNIPMHVVNHVYSEQGCLAAGTKIRMEDGTLKAIELVEIGDTVMTVSGSQTVTRKFVPEELEQSAEKNGMFEIEFTDGSKVKATGNHKFLIDGEWVRVSDMTINSILDS